LAKEFFPNGRRGYPLIVIKKHKMEVNAGYVQELGNIFELTIAVKRLCDVYLEQLYLSKQRHAFLAHIPEIYIYSG